MIKIASIILSFGAGLLCFGIATFSLAWLNLLKRIFKQEISARYSIIFLNIISILVAILMAIHKWAWSSTSFAIGFGIFAVAMFSITNNPQLQARNLARSVEVFNAEKKILKLNVWLLIIGMASIFAISNSPSSIAIPSVASTAPPVSYQNAITAFNDWQRFVKKHIDDKGNLAQVEQEELELITYFLSKAHSVSDDDLRSINPQCPYYFRTKLVDGAALFKHGVIAENVQEQIKANGLMLEWQNWEETARPDLIRKH